MVTHEEQERILLAHRERVRRMGLVEDALCAMPKIRRGLVEVQAAWVAYEDARDKPSEPTRMAAGPGDLPRPDRHSSRNSKSLASTCVPGLTSSSTTLPACSAYSVVSIFMASSDSSF